MFDHSPYLRALFGSSEELKTKPTQHSVKALQEQGVQADILVLRTEHNISPEIRKKVALFCNVDTTAVMQSIDVPTIYRVPLNMQPRKADRWCSQKWATISKQLLRQTLQNG